jgi:hypothetical protein
MYSQSLGGLYATWRLGFILQAGVGGVGGWGVGGRCFGQNVKLDRKVLRL